jgi:hypothetical protein
MPMSLAILVDLIVMLGAGKNAGAAQSVDRRMVGRPLDRRPIRVS